MSQYEKLVNYIDAASALAENMQADIKEGDTYTDETVLALSQFIAAAYEVKDMLDTLEEKNIKLN